MAKVEWNKRLSYFKPCYKLVSYDSLTHSLTIIAVGFDLEAIFLATFMASSTVYSVLTTLLTRPLWAASYASMKSPVKVSSIALDFPIIRVNL